MRFLLDSNVLIDVARGNLAAIDYVDGLTESWAISQVTALELIVGARDKREVATIDGFLSPYPVVPLSESIGTRAYELQGHIDRLVTDTAIVFAIHARRILDINAIRTQFIRNEPFRHWAASRLPRVTEFREALNRIVHATEFEVGFERLPEGAANIQGGAIGVVYLQTKTDKREEALIDVFSLASCFFHQVLPVLRLPPSSSLPETTH